MTKPMKILVLAALLAAPLASYAHADDAADLARYRQAEKIGKERLAETHAPDILVHYPDGHTTKGLPDHIKELKFMFTWAPDTKISEHPVRLADGEWTSVYGVGEGTFTKPMVIGGKTIQPTGKTFHINMVTIGHWTKAGVMDEEYLFLDNAKMMQELGVTS
jgi:hypothetical protein